MPDVPSTVLALLEHVEVDEHGNLNAGDVSAELGVAVRHAAQAAAQHFEPKVLLTELFAAVAEAGTSPHCVNVLALLSDLWEGSNARDAVQQWRR